MSGYKWDPVFRVVPVNGNETVYWLTDRLTDLGGHTRIGLRYAESMSVREDVNRSLRPVVYGIRPEVSIECQVFSMADQQFLAEIESALLDPRYYDVYLSLDGGCVERRVVLGGVADPQPLAGKTVIGARFSLRLRCADLIARRPAMMTDPDVGSELVQDGGIEAWESSSQPQSWSGSGGVITVAQETTIVRSGASSAKVTRSDGVTFGQFTHRSASASINPKPGRWYRLRASARGSSDLAVSGAGPFRIEVFNAHRSEFIASDGKTAGPTASVYPITGVLAASWTDIETHFRVPSNWLDADTVNLRFTGYWTSGQSLYYDDLSIYGPVLRPGYSTW